MGITTITPLEDPAYVPTHPPVSRAVPDVVAKWGPRSQFRWFRRFRGQIAPMRHAEWARFYCSSVEHRGLCCESYLEDVDLGYEDYDPERCCPYARSWPRP